MILAGDAAGTTYEIWTQTGTFVATGNLLNGFNAGATALVLNNGNVMIFGSSQTPPPSAPGTWEIRTAAGAFVSTGSLFSSRGGAAAVLLSTENVFITGGSFAPGSWEIRNQSGGFVSQGNLFDARGPGHRDVHF